MQLEPNEVMIMRESQVTEKTCGKVSLILTNKNIYQSYTKGFWNPETITEKYPLIKIRDNKGKPNILLSKGLYGEGRLELVFIDGGLVYDFSVKNTEKKCAKSIEKAYKEVVSEEKKLQKSKLNVGSIFDPLKGTFENARNSLIAKTKESKTKVVKCPKCGAEVVGSKGNQVRCSYCDAVVTIK